MMTELEIPNFGELLGPWIVQVPEQAIPNFLALLERGAAERYRGWAELVAEHREGLLACASREDEIADRADALFPLDPALQEQVQAPLPQALDAYFEVFANLDAYDQMRIQANAERQGAAAWRGMITLESSPAANAELEALASLEELSADFLDQLFA